MKKPTAQTLSDIALIGASLSKIMASKKMTFRFLAQDSGLSINSVKTILSGGTANIACYDMISRSLGTTLLSVVNSLDTSKVTPQENIAEVSVEKPRRTKEVGGKVTTDTFQF